MKRKLWMLTLLFLMSGWAWVSGESRANCGLYDHDDYEEGSTTETDKVPDVPQETVKK